MSENRIAAATLAAFGAASAIPIPLAQFDFAGLVNVFDIDSGDSPRALLVMAGIGGFLTIAVLAVAFAGAGLALAGAPPLGHSLSRLRSPDWSRQCLCGFRQASSLAPLRSCSVGRASPVRRAEAGTSFALPA
jgi:hypothetical protein